MQIAIAETPINQSVKPASSLDLFIQAMDALEATAVPLEEPARRALTAMIETVDVAFQTARAIASGVDHRSADIRQPFLFTAMKMFEVNRRLGQLDSSAAARCLRAMEGSEAGSPFSEN
ncbi:hypothetical protein [Agrobacterium tumefaciens]|uniref:hypothetical protein n=1 Tax=Agrobacterium tumefaciens TaxID=358 RepID=UPI0015732FBE|nr:hypothetical protein [Agrobacterium tumefaciens]